MLQRDHLRHAYLLGVGLLAIPFDQTHLTQYHRIKPPLSKGLMSKLSRLKTAALCSLLLVLCVVACLPSLEMGLNDDWAYIWSARLLAVKGHVVYNGWETTMLGWQLYFGALFIKLFGFSFFVLRFSTLLVSIATCVLLQRLFVRLGINPWNSAIATLTIVLSPLFLLLSYSFMSDVPGLFVLVVCIYACLRTMQAKGDRGALIWVVFAALSNAVGGTVRQLGWLGVLVVVPCTIWLTRRRKGMVVGGSLAWVVSVGSVLLLMRWFKSQPYTISEPAFIKSNLMPHYIQPGIKIVQAVLAISLLVLPVMSAFLVRYPQHLRRRRNADLAAGTALAAFLMFAMRHRTIFESLPLGTHYVTTRGVALPGVLGLQPIVFSTPVRVGLMMLIVSSLLCFLGALVTRQSRVELPAAVQERNGWKVPSSSQTLTLLGPLTIASVALLVTRGALFDRYYLSILVLFVVLILRVYELRVGGRLPLLSTALVALFALYGIATTHDFFALGRARVAAADEVRAAGVPRSQIRGGFEYDGTTELEITGYVNDSRITKPVGAYRPMPPWDFSDPCASWFAEHTPSIQHRYVLAHDDSCFMTSRFAPVVYRTWFPWREQKIFIREVPTEQ